MAETLQDYLNRKDVQAALLNDPDFAKRLLAWIQTMAQIKSMMLMPYDLEAKALETTISLLRPANQHTLALAAQELAQQREIQLRQWLAALQAQEAAQNRQLQREAMAQQRALAERQMGLAEEQFAAQQAAQEAQRADWAAQQGQRIAEMMAGLEASANQPTQAELNANIAAATDLANRGWFDSPREITSQFNVPPSVANTLYQRSQFARSQAYGDIKAAENAAARLQSYYDQFADTQNRLENLRKNPQSAQPNEIPFLQNTLKDLDATIKRVEASLANYMPFFRFENVTGPTGKTTKVYAEPVLFASKYPWLVKPLPTEYGQQPGQGQQQGSSPIPPMTPPRTGTFSYRPPASLFNQPRSSGSTGLGAFYNYYAGIAGVTNQPSATAWPWATGRR
jgi:hypothetical protein